MHYTTDAFVHDDCYGCKTIEVNNVDAYRAQGSPEIGESTELSTGDIQQANSLYSCPKRGVSGTLVVRIRNGQSLPDTDYFSVPDPYIKLTAIDSSGTKYTQTTAVRGGTFPNWNKSLNFPNCEWQFFRIQVIG